MTRSCLSCLFAFALLPATSAGVLAEVHHIDATHGDDSRSGSSPEQAWRSLEKANSIELKPGDQLLFRAGEHWTGQLKPKGSGNEQASVTIGRYGDGAPPRIDGGGASLDTLLLENTGFVEIADLEITNHGPAPAPRRTGVKVSARGTGTLRRIMLRRLFVHDVNGDLRKSQEGCGIFFEATGGNNTRFDGLLIENCHVARSDRNGICQRGTGEARSRNVIIRGNLLEDIGGDGIKLWGTDGGLIERNVVRKARARCAEKEGACGIWPFACDDTVIQFNEVSDTAGTSDGQAYDSDYRCHRTIFQYNYGFRNEGGFMLVCSPGNEVNEDTVIRYNISVRDGVNSASVFHFGGGARRTRVYNNTIVIGPSQALPLLLFDEWSGGKARDTRFSNNLFIVEAGGRASCRFGSSSGNVFEDNLFAGRHEGLPQGVAVAPAPELAGPLNPVPGFDSLKAFRPLDGRGFPRGRVIAGNGGRDILGNPVSAGHPPAIGAVEPAS